jgi:hypothetical protein
MNTIVGQNQTKDAERKTFVISSETSRRSDRDNVNAERIKRTSLAR